MKLIDKQYMAAPFYGARKITAWLKSEHHSVNRKHVRRLMQLMGLRAIYWRPRTFAIITYGADMEDAISFSVATGNWARMT